MSVHLLTIRTTKDFATKCGAIFSLTPGPETYTAWASEVTCAECTHKIIEDELRLQGQL